jgi:hypothetical protein
MCHELIYVSPLPEHDFVSLATDLHVEKIFHFSFVLDFPLVLQRFNKLRIQRVGVGVGSESVEVVDVTSDEQAFVTRSGGRLYTSALEEHGRVLLALSETLLGGHEPRKDRTLPASTSLSHAIYGLLHTANASVAVRVALVTWRRVAVDYFVVE